jgi:hypothetical protein
VTAVVAVQAARTVKDERDVAVGALPGATAGAAAEERREAAPVDENDRLSPFGRQGAERLAGARMQDAGATRAPAQVEDLDRRQAPAIDALGQLDPLELGPALRPRRRRAEDERGAGRLRAPAGDLARVVARVALLLVGRVVLLVDDDQAEPVDRREHGRARPDADPRLARAEPVPLVAPRAGGEP